MNIERLFEKPIKLIKISENEYEVKHGATFRDGSPIKVKIVKELNTFLFSDDQCTLKYMNEHYELKKSADVKMCIANVVKLYGFSIQGGKLLAKIGNESEIINKFFDFINCIVQLANMHVFFDNPDE